MFDKPFLPSRGLRVVSAAALGIALAVLSAQAFSAQDKYTLRVPNRAGVPGNGKPFPEGSKIAKIEWKPKKNTEARVPDVLQDVFFIEKNTKKFPDAKGWAYAAFDYDPASDTFKPDASGVVNCGFACHTRVAAKDYIFTAYGKR